MRGSNLKGNKTMVHKIEWKQLKDSEGILLYEGHTVFNKPYGLGKTFFSDGTVYQDGEFGIKGLLKGKEFYPNGKLRFEGTFHICKAYGPNYPEEGKCYDEEGNLYYQGIIKCRFGGVGYSIVEVPELYGPIPQDSKPDIHYFMWEDEAHLNG